MKLIHISDLHFGKSFKGLNLIETQDQTYWVEQFLRLLDAEKPDVVMIAGDIYDHSNPANNAIELLNYFLTSLAERHIRVFIIAGNHDSASKLEYGSKFFHYADIHIATKTEKEMYHVKLHDEYGDIVFWLMPYTTQTTLKAVYETNFNSDNEAFAYHIQNQNIDTSLRNVLIAHQFVKSGSKEIELGGSENYVGGSGAIDASVFDVFDYVALGHIHAAYPVSENIRYCGSIMNYHFDETKKGKKGPLVIAVQEKEKVPIVTLQTVPLLHTLRIVSGSLQSIRESEKENDLQNEYMRYEITDEKLSPYILASLDQLASDKNSVCLEVVSRYDENFQSENMQATNVEELQVDRLFELFYQQRTSNPVSVFQKDILHYLTTILDTQDISETTEKLLKYLEGKSV